MIHPTAMIDPDAQLASDVSVGAYSVIGRGVRMGRGTRIASHVVVEGPTQMGEANHIYSFASIGAAPQDKKYADEPTELIIGDRNVIREGCTLNRGTVQDKGKTVIGNDNWIMAYVHIAHDCIVGNHTVFANNATLAGHVTIRDHVILGGFTLVHQFCVIGEHAFTGMGSAISKDVPPYVMVTGVPAEPRGINTEGLRRRQFSSESMQRIRDLYRLLYRQHLSVQEALSEMEQRHGEWADAQLFIEFCRQTERGLIR